jgi:hypothetical protein
MVETPGPGEEPSEGMGYGLRGARIRKISKHEGHTSTLKARWGDETVLERPESVALRVHR